MIRFEILDGDGDFEHNHDPIGYMETTLSYIMASPKQIFKQYLKDFKTGEDLNSKIQIKADSVSDSNNDINLIVKASL